VSAAWLSLLIATGATTLVAALGIPLAYGLARSRFRGRSAIDTLLTIPLVLPPTVVGYLILVTFGARGWPGRLLHDWFGYSIVFRIEGAILAAAVVAFPLLYLPARAAFLAVERELEDVASLFGASRIQIFRHISLPAARHAILGGVVLAFARALGEFGATVMVFGLQPGRQTLPISIYSAFEQGELAGAWPAVALLIALCFALIVLRNRVARD
jgi:molybdate transport system permease protein